jgi:putative membrane protein
MTFRTSLLRAALCAGCVLSPQILFAQDTPDPEEQPMPPGDQPQVTEEQRRQEEQRRLEEQRRMEQQGQGQQGQGELGEDQQGQGQQGLEQGQMAGADQTLTSLFEFGRNEIIVGLIGNARAESQQVKKLSGQIIRDNQKSGEKIVSHAIKQKLELMPTGTMPPQIQELQTVQGADFDRQYVDMLVTTHQQQVDQLATQVEQTQDKQLKGILKENHKMVQRHLEQAQRAQKQLEATASAEPS